MFHVVPDPDEVIDEDALTLSEMVGYEEGEQLRAEFRALIESLTDWPEERITILAALDDMDASSNEPTEDGVEWMNVRDVLGRRIRTVLAKLL